MWRQVLVAGPDERVVGMARLDAGEDGLETARLHLRIEMRKGWAVGEAADFLFDAALAGAHATGAAELWLAAGDDEAVGRKARERGFELVVRKEMRRARVLTLNRSKNSPQSMT